MRILNWLIIALSLTLSPAASAATQEGNKWFLDQIRNSISSSIIPREDLGQTKSGYNKELFRVSVEDITVYSIDSFDKDTGELVLCEVIYTTRSKVNHFYTDDDCDGTAAHTAVKDGKVLVQELATIDQYNKVLELVLPAFNAAGRFNKSIPAARFTLVYDWVNVNATQDEMQAALLKIEQFPNFSYTRPYSFGVLVEETGFYFSFNVNKSRMQALDCRITKFQSQTNKSSWLDKGCDGAFEWEDPDGDGMFRKYKSEGSEVALKMKAYMQQAHRFVMAYQSLLKLPE